MLKLRLISLSKNQKSASDSCQHKISRMFAKEFAKTQTLFFEKSRKISFSELKRSLIKNAKLLHILDYGTSTHSQTRTKLLNVKNVGRKVRPSLTVEYLRNFYCKNFICSIIHLVCRYHDEVFRTARERQPWSTTRVYSIVDTSKPLTEVNLISGAEMAESNPNPVNLVKYGNFLTGNQMKIFIKHQGQVELLVRRGKIELQEYRPKTGWEHMLCEGHNFTSDTPYEIRNIFMCNDCKVKQSREHDDTCHIRGIAEHLKFLRNIENGIYQEPCSIGAIQFMMRRLLHAYNPAMIPKLKTMDSGLLYTAAIGCHKTKQLTEELTVHVNNILRLGRIISGSHDLKHSWRPTNSSLLVSREPRKKPVTSFNPKTPFGKNAAFLIPTQSENITLGEKCEKSPKMADKTFPQSEKLDTPKSAKKLPTPVWLIDPTPITSAQPPSHNSELKKRKREVSANFEELKIKTSPPELDEIGGDFDDDGLSQMILDLTASEGQESQGKAEKSVQNDKNVQMDKNVQKAKTPQAPKKRQKTKVSKDFEAPRSVTKIAVDKGNQTKNKKSSGQKAKNKKSKPNKKKSNPSPDDEPLFTWIISALQDDGKIRSFSDLIALKIETDRLIMQAANRVIEEIPPSEDRRNIELFSELFFKN